MSSRHVENLGSMGILGSAIAGEKVEAAASSGHSQRVASNPEISKLVQRLFILPGLAKAPGAVTFCGVNSGSGCSWVCACAGESLAQQVSASVCVVDGNLRRPSLHEYFRVPMKTGFADLMISSAPAYDFARRLAPMNLWLVTAGSAREEPNGTFSAVKLRSRFAELRNEFDFVLIDTPALDSYPDGVLLGQQTDGIILVVGSHRTRRETALSAKRNIEAAQIPMLGAVLNRRTFPIPEAIYRNI